MSRSTRNTILASLGALGVLLLLIFLSDDKKTYSWNEDLRGTSDQPYGTLFIKRLLEESRNGKFQVRDKKSLSGILTSDDFKKESSYVFIGQTLFLNAADKEALLSFISAGNTAFIASSEVPELIDEIYDQECGAELEMEDNREMTSAMNFYHSSFHEKYGYKFTYRILDEDIQYNWRTFSSHIFCDVTSAVTPVGYIEEDRPNFIRIRHGDGALYLHSNPAAFSNYFIIQKEKAQYASAAFSHLGGKNTVWEEFAKVPMLPDSKDSMNSPLYYIMQQPSLKYAWWMIAGSALLYVLFAAKRMQRVVPVLEAKTNTSLEFVRMIAALHYQNKDHMDMARKKMKYFLYFIRSKYSVQGHPMTDEMMQKLAERSNVPLPEIEAVFKFQKLIEQGSGGTIDAIRLSNFYNVIENFYKKCK